VYIKPQTVIPAGTKITRLPASNKKVPSLFVLEKRHERQLEREAEMKREAEEFAQLLKEGHTAREALIILGRI